MTKLTAILLNILFIVLLGAAVLGMVICTYASMDGYWSDEHTVMICVAIPLAIISVVALNFIDRRTA